MTEGASVRILAVSYSFPPMAYPRAVQVARLLEELQASVVVICGSEELSDSPWARDQTVAPDVERRLEHLIREPARRSRLSDYTESVANRVGIYWSNLPDPQRAWIARAGRRYRQWEQQSGYRPDVVVTFGQPMSDHLFGLAYRRQTGIPWIAHFSDPWVGNPFRQENLVTASLNRRMEYEVLRDADALVFTSPETIEFTMRRYPESWRRKAYFLSHCYDPGDYDRSILPPDDRYLIRFMGTLYGRRTPTPLFEAIERIGSQSPALLRNLSIEFVGPLEEFRAPLARYKHARQVTQFVGIASHAESLRLMQASHCLLVIDAPSDCSVFFPSKLVEYIGADRFIFALSPPGTAARVVGELGGAVADPSCPAEVAAALANILERRPHSLTAQARYYEKEAASARFLEVVHAVLRARCACALGGDTGSAPAGEPPLGGTQPP